MVDQEWRRLFRYMYSITHRNNLNGGFVVRQDKTRLQFDTSAEESETFKHANLA
jgi:hypothetical protein